MAEGGLRTDLGVGLVSSTVGWGRLRFDDLARCDIP